MSIDPTKVDSFYMALQMVSRAPSIKQQIDVISFVIDGKIAQLWEEAPGMTREKTRLIEAKHRLQKLREKKDVQPPQNESDEEQERYSREFAENRQPLADVMQSLMKHYAPSEPDRDDDSELGDEY